MRSLFIVLVCISIVFGRYNRRNWSWVQVDNKTTRDAVLAEEHMHVAPLIYNDKGKVINGVWLCRYTGNMYIDPRKLDIDHMVPLKEAYVSGAKDWSIEQKKQYANDTENPNHLVAVYRSANRSKGSKDPARWMPDVNRCWYVKEWLKVKTTWKLSMDPVEMYYIFRYLNDSCTIIGPIEEK